MSEPELLTLLRKCYAAVPDSRKGSTKIIDYDPAGSTYEFTEHEWSKKIRLILDIKHEPLGV